MAVINTVKLRKEFGTLVAVNDVDFQVEPGSIIGLIGPNGAGKTTLLRMIATLDLPTKGTIEVLGYDSASQYHQIRQKVAFLPDFFNLYKDLTLAECLAFFAKSYSVPDSQIPNVVTDALTKVGLTSKSQDYCKNLSRGMVQRLGMAVLLVRDPDIYLLDEPASGLDPAARIQLKNLIKEIASSGKTVVISSHILTELADFCSDVAIMDHGSIVLYGSVDNIRQEMSASASVTISVIDNAEHAVKLLEESEMVNSITANGNSITFSCDSDNTLIAQLNCMLAKNDIPVYSIQQNTMNLEDIFMRISGNGNESKQVG